MKTKKVMCPICNEPHFRNTGFEALEPFTIHMMREHNWSTQKAVQYWLKETGTI